MVHLSAPIATRLRRKEARRKRQAPIAQARAERRAQRANVVNWGPLWGTPYCACFHGNLRLERMKRKGERAIRARLAPTRPATKPPVTLSRRAEVKHEGILRSKVRSIGRGVLELGRKLGGS
jgi:hypothetical protein